MKISEFIDRFTVDPENGVDINDVKTTMIPWLVENPDGSISEAEGYYSGETVIATKTSGEKE